MLPPGVFPPGVLASLLPGNKAAVVEGCGAELVGCGGAGTEMVSPGVWAVLPPGVCAEVVEPDGELGPPG